MDGTYLPSIMPDETFLELFFDGSCLENPVGPGGAAWILLSHRLIIAFGGSFIPLGTLTNNTAEYQRLIQGLRHTTRITLPPLPTTKS